MTRRHCEDHDRPRRDLPAAVGDGRGVEPERRSRVVVDGAQAAGLVERGDAPEVRPGGGDGAGHGQWTILESGISKMSEAPWSRSAGMRMLMSDLATTASRAKAPPPESSEMVGAR